MWTQPLEGGNLGCNDLHLSAFRKFWIEEKIGSRERNYFMWLCLENSLHACFASFFCFNFSLRELQIQRRLYPIFPKVFRQALNSKIWATMVVRQAGNLGSLDQSLFFEFILKNTHLFLMKLVWNKTDKILNKFYVGSLERWGQISSYVWHARRLHCCANRV